MNSLFVAQAPKRGRSFLMLGASVLLHGGLVGVAVLWTPPEPTDHSVLIGEIGDFEGSNPTPAGPKELPQYAPVETPVPQTVDTETAMDPTPPPTTETPDFALLAPTVSPRKTLSSVASATTNRSTSMHATSHVVSGQATGATAVGANGGSANTTGGWVMPHPPYPHLTLALHVTGATTIRITTNAAGEVTNVVILRSTGNPVLDQQTETFVRGHWHGPANASRTTEFVYQIQ